jgi:glucose-6-phosphate isomerase
MASDLRKAPTAPTTVPVYRHAIAGCLDSAIGRHGLSSVELSRWLEPLGDALAALKHDYHSHRLPQLRIAEETADLAAAESALRVLSRGAETIVFFAVGGSSLGGQALAQLGGWNIPGVASEWQRRQPRTRFYDNLDGATLASALASFDLATTRFVVISKSGGTPETLVQTLAALAAVRQAGLAPRVGEMFLGITEPARTERQNGLRALFEAHGIPLLDYHPGIGAHYSVFTNVGLLPAMARGLNAEAVRAGASDVLAALMAAKSPLGFAPAEGAAIAVALARERGVRAHVLMPYSDRLGRFAQWFAHLWGESLGKGGEGTLPIACLGPLDQHSRLKLIMDGPRHYLISLVRTPSAGVGPRISRELAAYAGIDYLAGHTAGDLVAAQAMAVAEALARAGRAARTFDLPVLDERSVGALMMHFMLETILAARLIGVDPFDQPALELVKDLTRRGVAALPKA